MNTATRDLIAVAILTGLLLAIIVTTAKANCHTHSCAQRVHHKRVIHSVEKKIARITPYRCWGQRSVKPCFVIAQESLTSGFWTAWNAQSCGSGYHARGLYQLCGHGEPWPVLVPSKYETLKRKLAHHRIARALPLSAWGF